MSFPLFEKEFAPKWNNKRKY